MTFSAEYESNCQNANAGLSKAFGLLTASLIISLLGTAAHANMCEPDLTLDYKVHGVESWDTLNVREGPSTDFKVVTTLQPNERGIRLTGNYLIKNQECQDLCQTRSSPDQGISECFAKGKIWYEVDISRYQRGWASAKHLVSELPTQDTPEIAINSTEKTSEDANAEALNEQAPLTVSSDSKLLVAQTFIADIEQYIGSGESNFDLGFVTEFSKIRNVKEGEWNPSLEAAFEGFKKYALSNESFQKYFAERTSVREREANERLIELRDELNERSGLMRSWAQSNLLDSRTEQIMTMLNKIEVSLSTGEIDELESTLNDAIALAKEVGISAPVLVASSTNSPFVSDSVYLFGNFSGTAPHIFKGISGAPELADAKVSVCLYSDLDKWQLFTIQDYLSGRLAASEIELYNSTCSGNEDVFVALGSRLITGGLPPDFSTSYEELQRLDRTAALAVKEKFDVISEIFQDEVLKSEKNGYGMLIFDPTVNATCALVQEDLSLHIDALTANSQILQLFGDILEEVKKSENVNDAFRKIQRSECGNVYATASDLVILIAAARNNQMEFDFLPFWVSNEAIAALAVEKTESEKARLSDEEARLQRAQLQKEAEEALRKKALSEQNDLRKKYDVRFSVIADELTTATKAAVEFGFTHSPFDSNYAQEYLKLPILDAQNVESSAFDSIIHDIQDLALEKWEQIGIQVDKADYGIAEYNGRVLEGVVIDVNVEIKNRIIGDFDTYCRTIRAVIDDDFDMWRNIEIDQCGLVGNNWRLANRFESKWIVSTEQ